MLQRAASNAYSWWWASHIRTKQSKWLDGNLQEMEDRVKTMLKLIEEDADSFARRAEMYFKRRPELISVVEEAYRAYRALAERYDHISGELHKANHTIATAFPDQVQYAMLEEEDDNFPKAITPIDPGKINKPVIEGLVNKKKENRPSLRKAQQKKNAGQIDKEKAQEEINKLQKGILVLQTEKEFIKSSYESGIAKYWEIEKKIMEMQEDVFYLEDEFSASAVIEDDEARALMTTTALKSCEDAMVRLQEQREKSMKNAKAESERIKLAVEKLRALKGESSKSNMESVEASNENSEVITFLVDIEEEAYSLNKEKNQLHTLCEKVKEHIQTNPDASALEITEDINELVNRIIELELTISSQTAQIDRLSSENNDLEKHLQSLEEEKTVLANDTDELTKRLREAEDELSKVQIIEKNVHDEERNFRANFTEFFNSFNDISEKMESPILHEDAHMMNPFLDEEESEVEEVTEVHDIMENLMEDEELSHGLDDSSRSEAGARHESNSHNIQETDNEHETKDKDSIHADLNIDRSCNQKTQLSEEDVLALQQLLVNCPEAMKTLSELEKKNENSLDEMIALIRELKNANVTKDEEIRMLRQELSFLKTISSRNADAVCGQGKDSGRGHRRLRSMSNFSTLMVGSNSKPSKMPPKPTLKSKATRNKSVEAMDIGTPLPEGIITPPCSDNVSPIEEKFRRDIDVLLEENLEFWLRFSTSFHHVHEFQSKFDDVLADIDKFKDKNVQEGATSSSNDQISSKVKPAPAAAHLRALKTELQVWLEQSQILRRELEARFSSLCSIQEEICGVVNAGPENAEAKITPYQAAKFQGEVLNMQQENNKVASELQVGQNHVKALQAEIEKELSKLYSSFEPSTMSRTNNNNQLRNFPVKARVPLRAFLFNAKPKKPSIFSCMNPNFLKQHADLRNRGFR